MNPKPFSPVYLIYGEEHFLIQELHRRYLAAIVEPSTQAFNYNLFKGGETEAADILGAALMLPVLAEKRLVWVWEADQIDFGGNTFLDYLENPSPSTVLVLAATKPDFRKKIFSTLRSRAELISCARMPDRELSRWISERAKAMGLTLPSELVAYLKESIGNNLHRIVNELEKIQLTRGEQGEISLEAAREVVVGSRKHSVFDWLRALGGKDLSLSLQYLQALLSDGEHPLFLLTMAVRQLRQMILAKEHLSSGGNPSELSRVLGLPPSVTSFFLQQLKGWTEKQIKEAMELCLEIDLQLKGGSLPAERLLEGMVFDLCQGSWRRSPKTLLY